MSANCSICSEHSLNCKCGVQNIGCLKSGPLHDMRISLHSPEFVPIPDHINHPTHYQGNNLETIDVIEKFKLGFHLGNAIKYILRAGKKGYKEEDLRKAIWYLEREINNERN